MNKPQLPEGQGLLQQKSADDQPLTDTIASLLKSHRHTDRPGHDDTRTDLVMTTTFISGQVVVSHSMQGSHGTAQCAMLQLMIRAVESCGPHNSNTLGAILNLVQQP